MIRCLPIALLASLTAASSGDAQLSTPGIISVEAFVTQYSLDDPSPRGRVAVGGGGARVMINLGGSSDAPTLWGRRPSVGAFLVVTSEQKEIETFHVGGQFDAHLFRGPLGGRFRGVVDPFFSIGIGAFRLSASESLLGLPADERSSTEITAVPGAGTHIRLTRRFALRGDLRDVVIFGQETTHNFEASAGLSINF